MLGRSTSFRPRPIDINQKLAVYLGGDAQNLGNSPSLEAPSTPELGGGTPKRRPRNAKPILEPEDIEAAIEECNANDDAAPIKPQEVATPSFRTIDDEEYTAPEPANPWKRPAKYIQHVVAPTEKPLAALEKSVEYDLDSDDESFRLALNTKMKNKSVLNENTLEKLIDTFEKEYFRQVKAKGILATVWDSEEDFRCNVCNSAATEPKNPIIYCDTCDMTTHVECYGLHNTPRGSWFCTKCKSKEQLEVSCILCTERNGAFKRTKDGEWVHLACAMWLSEKENVLVPTNLKSTFVVDTSGVAREKRDLLCCICGRSHGGCVTCSHSGCQSTYHITCAMRMGLFAEIKKSKTTTFKSFCKKHSTLYCEKKKESQKTKRRKEEEKILGEEYTQLIPVTMLTVRNLGRLNKEVVQDTYDYWKKKRLAAGRPLIGRLQIEEEEIRHSSSYKQEREYTEMRKIRQGMEIARLLLDLVGKRERLKQRQLATMQELFEQELLLGEPFELPKTKAKGEKEKKTTQPAKKETSVTHRRKSSGGAVKATVQQEIDDAVKKSATTSRRKSSTALPDDARKQAAAKKKEEEEEVADAGAKRKRSEVEGGNKRPRATKTRRRSNSLESGAEHEETEGAKTPAKKTTPATKKPEARNLSANKVVGGDQPKPRAVYKRKSEQTGEDEVEEDKVDAANEKGKTTTRRQDEEQGKKKTATTAEVSPVKRVAKRRRLSASPTKAEPMEEEKVVNIVDSDEDVPAAKASTKGKNVSTRKAAPKDEEEEPEEEGERDDHDDDESNEGEQDGDDQDYMKGKRKRKRRSLNEVTAQRVTRAQAKWSSPHDEEPEEAAPLPVVSKKAAPSGAHRPSSAAANKKPQPPKPSKLPSAGSATSKAAPAVKVDVVDDDDDEEDDDNGSSEEESYSPTTSPESSPLRRGKDTDGPIVAKKKRQTKINGFFAVVKKAEKTSAMAKRRRRSGEKARLAGSNKDKDVDEEDDDERSVNERMVEKNREEEVDDDMDDDDNDHEEEKGRGKKKVKAKRTSGGGRRSLAQQKATAAAAAAAAAKRPLQAKKSR